MPKRGGAQLRIGGVPIRDIPVEPVNPNRALSDKQRKKLEGIRNLEDVKKKRERLCNVLTQKLCVKYGPQNKSVISALVDQFVAEKVQIAPDDLAKLEKEVVLAVKSKNDYPSKAAEVHSEAKKQQFEAQQGAEQQAASKSNNEQSLSYSASDLTPPPPGSEWKVIQAYQILMAEEKAKEEQAVARNKKIQFKKDLDSHIANAKLLKEKTADKSDAKYFELIKQDIANYHEEERTKSELIQKKHHNELLIQKQQIVEKKARHEAEMKELRKMEEEMLAEAQQKIQDEANKVAANRRRAKEQQAIVDRDNEANQKIKDAQAQRDAEEDQRLMREYAAKLDKDDYDRANAFAERMAKMEAFNAKFEKDGAGKAIKEEKIKMEQLLLKEQAKHEAELTAKEEKKVRDKKMRLQRMMTENEKLVARRKAEEEKVRLKDVDYANAALADVEKFKKSEMEKKVKAHNYHLQYRKVLDDQMKNKPAQADPTSAAFLGREREINGSLFNKAAHDKNVLKKLNSPVKGKVTQVRVVSHK